MSAVSIQHLLDNINLVIVVLNKDGVVKKINKKGCEVLGFEMNEIEGLMWFTHFVPKDDRQASFNRFKEMLQKQIIINDEAYLLEKANSVRLINWSYSFIKNVQGVIEAFLLCGQDITEKRALQNRLELQEREKRKLIIETRLDAQEKERRRIASELHDNVGQILTTCKLMLDMEMQGDCSPRIIQTYQHLKKAIETIRTFSHQLNPVSLTHNELIGALQELINSINATSKLKINLLVHKDQSLLPLDSLVSLSIFRIIQEQFNNIIKHANASNVTVYLSHSKTALELEITDDGKGFAYSASYKGLGLRNIFNRAEVCNGIAVIHSNPGKGCILSVYIPINQ